MPSDVSTMREHPRWRTSNEERYRVVEHVGSHLAAGRLSVEEFDDRVKLILESRTMGELAELVDDLPFVDEDDREAGPAGPLRVHVQLSLLLAAFWVAFWHLSDLEDWFSPLLPVAVVAFSVGVHWTIRRFLRR